MKFPGINDFRGMKEGETKAFFISHNKRQEAQNRVQTNALRLGISITQSFGVFIPSSLDPQSVLLVTRIKT